MKTCKICNKEFKPFKTTDRYCSSSCFFSDQKAKPKKNQPIKKQSDKRKKENQTYLNKRKEFLLLPENKYCKAAKVLFNEIHQATEIHHLAGRKGKLLNYIPYWLPVCRKSHNWIHDNPDKSYELGLLIRPSTVNIS